MVVLCVEGLELKSNAREAAICAGTLAAAIRHYPLPLATSPPALRQGCDASMAQFCGKPTALSPSTWLRHKFLKRKSALTSFI